MSFEASGLMNGRGVAQKGKQKHPGEAGLDQLAHLRKQAHGSSLDTVKLESEMSVLDATSTSLHRAASHGDTDVLKMILDPNPLPTPHTVRRGVRRGANAVVTKLPPREDIAKKDMHSRTALHVAAYQGKCDAVAYLASKASKQDMEARDEASTAHPDGRTALQVLAGYNGVVRKHRSVVCDELLEDIEVESHLHRLSAAFFAARHFAVFYWPSLFVTLLVALCALSMGDPETEARDRRRMSIFVGFLASVGCALTVGMNASGFLSHAAAHASAEHDLADLVTELKFNNLTGFVDESEGEIASIDVALLHKRFEQIVQGCRAPFPAPLINLYSNLKSRLEHELFSHKVRRESDDFRLLRDMAYQRAQVVVTSGFGWPYMLPLGGTKGTVKRVVRTVMKRHRACMEQEPGKEKKLKGEILCLKDNEGLALDIKDASTAEGARAILFKLNGNPNQRWRLTSIQQLIPQHTLDEPSSMCLDIDGGYAEPDNEVQLWTAGKSDNMHQRWQLDEEGCLVSFVEGKFNVVGFAQVKGSGGTAKPTSGSELCLVKKGSPRVLHWKWLPVDAKGNPQRTANNSAGTKSPFGDLSLDGGGGGGGFDEGADDPELHRIIDGEDELD